MALLSPTTTTTLTPSPHLPKILTCLDPTEPLTVTDNPFISQDTAHLLIKTHVEEAGLKTTAPSRPTTSSRTTQDEDTRKKQASTNKPRIQPPLLVSSLRKSRRARASGRRVVRGLWNASCSSLFSQFHNDLMINILSCLDMKDLISASQVSRRWKHCAADDTLWQHVDATEFVRSTFQRYTSAKNPSHDTSQALHDCLKSHLHTMETLKIRDIEHRLDPNVFLPSASLQRLVLTKFTNLSDTHVQVMFLSTKNNKLQKLVLDDCPLLSNTTIQSISRHCSNLQDLSLQGCTNISNLEPLQNLWSTRQATSPTTTITSLQSLFAPPTSPVKPKPTMTTGKLCRVNLVGTSVTADALVTSLKTAAPGKVCLQQLYLDGETWNDALFQDFANAVDDGLECLEI